MSKKIEHVLVPEHEKLSEGEKKALLEKYGITENEMPVILARDPAIAHLNAKPGDIIKITRKSQIAGESIFYRVVKLE
ncbi:MAG: DNA-directed RNA polymerase subunit H [Candidatus Woesearchaeota archaeon]